MSLGATFTANAPGPALAFVVTAEIVPFVETAKTSTLLLAFSVARRNLPSGLKAMDPGLAPFALKYCCDSGIGMSCPAKNAKPVTLLLPAASSTYTRLPCWAIEVGSAPPLGAWSVRMSSEPTTRKTDSGPAPGVARKDLWMIGGGRGGSWGGGGAPLAAAAAPAGREVTCREQ